MWAVADFLGPELSAMSAIVNLQSTRRSPKLDVVNDLQTELIHRFSPTITVQYRAMRPDCVDNNG